MLKTDRLCCGYGGKEVFHSVSVHCPGGQITALIGPNGSGKSTLLKAMAGLLPTASGQIFVDGCDLRSIERQRMARTAAYLPQSRVVPDITAYRMVLHGRFPYLGYPRRYRKEDHAMVEKALKEVGAWELRHGLLSDLSGGERQRVYIAMVLAQDTPLLLLDEPTTYLDIGYQLETMEQIGRFKREGKTVVVVLHDLNLALTYADRVILLERGRTVTEGPSGQVAQSGALERVFDVKLKGARIDGREQYFFTR